MGPRRFQAASVRVPCSTSNLGAGFDCVGLAFQRHLHARFQPVVSETLITEYSGTLAAVDREEGRDRVAGPAFGSVPHNLLTRTFVERMRALGVPRVVGRLSADSDIPIARGLGSSAAAVVAAILLADAVLGRSPDAVSSLTLAAEREGHPDNAAPALLGGLVAVAHGEDGRPIALRLPLSDQVGFVFAAPAVDIPTPAARASLPAAVPHALAARSLGRVAALLQGLASADPTLLRVGLLDELHVPYRLPLIPRAGEAMHAAARAGAWGATISGSGSGLIALCPPGQAGGVLAAMERELAADGAAVTAFIAVPDPEGARVDEPQPHAASSSAEL